MCIIYSSNDTVAILLLCSVKVSKSIKVWYLECAMECYIYLLQVFVYHSNYKIFCYDLHSWVNTKL